MGEDCHFGPQSGHSKRLATYVLFARLQAAATMLVGTMTVPPTTVAVLVAADVLFSCLPE
jgi:hypothetical protein